MICPQNVFRLSFNLGRLGGRELAGASTNVVSYTMLLQYQSSLVRGNDVSQELISKRRRVYCHATIFVEKSYATIGVGTSFFSGCHVWSSINLTQKFAFDRHCTRNPPDNPGGYAKHKQKIAICFAYGIASLLGSALVEETRQKQTHGPKRYPLNHASSMA